MQKSYENMIKKSQAYRKTEADKLWFQWYDLYQKCLTPRDKYMRQRNSFFKNVLTTNAEEWDPKKFFRHGALC